MSPGDPTFGFHGAKPAQHADSPRSRSDADASSDGPLSHSGAHRASMSGKRLGEYRIIQEIGRGGMGTVFEAIQEGLGRRVALKVLRGSAILDDKAIRRFHREAEAVAQLKHPNIVPVYSVGEESGTHYYSMELVEGVSLSQVIRCLRDGLLVKQDPFDPVSYSGQEIAVEFTKHGSLPTVTVEFGSTEPNEGESRRQSDTRARRAMNREFINTAVEIIAQAADALDHAHSHGIVHRDVKPSNLLLSGRAKVMLTDFGLARGEGSHAMTLTEDIVGTPMYMSPEQALGRHGLVDHRSDIFSLGITLYELVTLAPPYESTETHALMRDVATKDPISFRQLSSTLPRDLELVTFKAIEKDPDRRYQSARDFADDLRRFLNYEAVHAKPASMATRCLRTVKRQRVKLVAIGAALALTCLVSVLVSWHWRNRAQAAKRELVGKAAEFVNQGFQQFGIANEAKDEEAAERAFEEATRRFTAALAIDTENPLAKYGLQELYLVRAQRALDRGAYEFARGLLLTIRNTDVAARRGAEVAAYERIAVGTGTWKVETVPPGCAISLARLDKTFVPGKFEEIGKSPLTAKDIPMGSYLVRVTHPDYAELQVPMYIQRNENENVLVTMLRAADVPQGMVYVPAGEFIYGDPETSAEQKIFLEGYFIDRTEVTGVEYEKFVAETGASPPASWGTNTTCPPALRAWPAYNVSWFDAMEFARWAGKRLPTQQEWEKAARGVDGRAYPWGNQFLPDGCNWRSARRESMRTALWPKGASVYGCLDIVGNVWEWTSDRDSTYATERIMRGGASYCEPRDLKAYLPQQAPPAGSSYGALNLTGFRCAKSLIHKPAKRVLDELKFLSDFDQAAQVYGGQKRWDLVQECVDRMLAMNPRSPPGHYWKGVCLRAQSKGAEALEAFKVSYLGMPSARFTKPNIDKLILELEKDGATVDKRFLAVPKMLAQAKAEFAEEKFAEAEQTLKGILEVDPNHTQAQELLGDICVATDRSAEAVAHYEHRIQAFRHKLQEEPGDPDAHNEFAWFLFQKKLNLSEALEISQRSIELRPDDPAFLDTLAELVFLHQRDASKATELIQRAMKLGTASVGVQQHLEQQLARFQKESRVEGQ